MAFQKVEREQRWDAFFDYVAGNCAQGTVTEVYINGKDNNGNDKGFVGIQLEEPCGASNRIERDGKKEDVKSTLGAGKIVAVSLTSATRVLRGTEGKRVRLTFEGFKQTDKGKYQDWTVEIDDGQD